MVRAAVYCKGGMVYGVRNRDGRSRHRSALSPPQPYAAAPTKSAQRTRRCSVKHKDGDDLGVVCIARGGPHRAQHGVTPRQGPLFQVLWSRGIQVQACHERLSGTCEGMRQYGGTQSEGFSAKSGKSRQQQQQQQQQQLPMPPWTLAAGRTLVSRYWTTSTSMPVPSLVSCG
jgi:hypothetical protein